ncbi:MAG: M20/M25/M40 family metallo-hydrolase [Acidimicrobiales bacterium]|jgi:acetylornithine deacetylase
MDETALGGLLAALVSIDSVNPDLVPGAAGEGRLADFVGAWLAEAGVDVSYQEVAPGRKNVIGRVAGRGGGRSLMMNAHLDTVGLASMVDGLQPVVRDGRLYGRGAQDMKSGLVAAMAVARAAVEMELGGDLVLAAVVDEEGDSKGSQALLEEWSADAAIVLEPTGHLIAPVHKGFVWADIEATGVAAHGSDPVTGVDAIVAMGHVLVEIERLGHDLQRRAAVAAVGTGSLHASLIEGGREPSTYPESCRLLVERRTVPGETLAEVTGELEAAVAAARAGAEGARWSAEVSVRLAHAPLATPVEAAVVQALRSACTGVLGSAEIGAVAFWTDAALLSEAGIPSVVFGVKGGGLHSAREWVELASLRSVTDVLAEMVRQWCGAEPGHERV